VAKTKKDNMAVAKDLKGEMMELGNDLVNWISLYLKELNCE
jgi:hypothetical protein